MTMLSLLAALMLQTSDPWPTLDDEPEIIFLPGIENPDGITYRDGDPEAGSRNTSDGSDTSDDDGDGDIDTVQIFMSDPDVVEIGGANVALYDVPRYLTEGLGVETDVKLVLRVADGVSGRPLTDLLNYLDDAGFAAVSVFVV